MRMFFFLVTLVVFSSSALSNEANVVQVASLAVKERIQSIEEINVTAKNPTNRQAASSTTIERILDEAAVLEKSEITPKRSQLD